MKKIFNSLLIIFLLSFLFTACKKKDAKISTSEKIQGTWVVQSEIYHEHVNMVDQSDTTLGIGATIEFRNDGKVYFNFAGEKDTASYTIVGDSQISLTSDPDDQVIYEITKLTSNSLIIYTKETEGDDYYEDTVFLSK